MKRLFSMLVVLLVAAVASRPTDLSAKPRDPNGDYNVVVGGMFKGRGVARIGANNISIDGDITDTNGINGEYNVKTSIMTENRFAGIGTVMGQRARFTGRVDTPDDKREKAIKGTRITATFKTDDGRYGRIIGFIPNDKRLPIEDERRGKKPSK